MELYPNDRVLCGYPENGYQQALLHVAWRNTDDRVFTGNDGAPLIVVSKQLGHAQASTTDNIYAHVIASAK